MTRAALPLNHIPPALFAAGLAAMLLAQAPVQAQSLYRCTEANGRITYSGKSCKETGNAGAEKAIDVPAAPPRSLAPPPRPSAASPTPVRSPGRRVAAMRVFYDPANAPIEHPAAKMHALIRHALGAWSAGCAVELEYGGVAPYAAPGSPERVSIRWSGELMYARHPDNDAAGIGGTGSLRDGVSLRPRVDDESLPRIIVHEIGHVLGIGHLHEDRQSVMSYVPNREWANSVQPSAADFLACNRAMKRRFGIDIVLPEEQPGRKMNDREAINRKMDLPVR